MESKIYDDLRGFTSKQAMQLHVYKLTDALDYDTQFSMASPKGVPFWSIETDTTVMEQYHADWAKQALWNDDPATANFEQVAFEIYFPYEAMLREHKLTGCYKGAKKNYVRRT